MRVFSFLIAFATFSCSNDKEIENPTDVDPESIYYDYRVWGEEGNEQITVMLQYRFRRKGNTLLLEEPYKVFFDGRQLTADSAKLTGKFFEAVLPLENFRGDHTIVFTDKNNKSHTEKFNFQPFTLTAEFPEQLKKEPFIIKLEDFPSEPTNVQVVMTDTSFASKDVNEEMLVEQGEIKIGSDQLKNLTRGPVTMEIYMDQEKRLKDASKAGGRLLISYGLKRQFELME